MTEDYLDNLFHAVYYDPPSGRQHSTPPDKSDNIQSVSGYKPRPSSGLRTNKSNDPKKSRFVSKLRAQSSSINGAKYQGQQLRPKSAKSTGKRTKESPETSKIMTSFEDFQELKMQHNSPPHIETPGKSPSLPILKNNMPVLAQVVDAFKIKSHKFNSDMNRFEASSPSSNVIKEPNSPSSPGKFKASPAEAVKEDVFNGRPVSKIRDERPYVISKQYGDMNEWISLRQNYVAQIEALDKYERVTGASQVLSEISLPNFYALLVALRKISLRIVENYRMMVLQKEVPMNMLEVHNHIVSMATDLNCLDRPPFTEWTGLHLSLNPFVCGYRLDGMISTTLSDLSNHSNELTRLLGPEGMPAMIPTELMMDQYETAECCELAKIVMAAYEEELRERKMRREQEDAVKAQMAETSARKVKLQIKREEFTLAAPEVLQRKALIRAWIAFKRAYDLEISIKNMALVRTHYIKRKVWHSSSVLVVIVFLTAVHMCIADLYANSTSHVGVPRIKTVT
jgi:hypothetical protein